jgi:aromatic-L-amino-acid decarboxylase
MEPNGYELEAASKRAAELFLEVSQGWESRRVSPEKSEAEVRSLFLGTLSDEGQGMQATLEEFAERVWPNAIGIPGPMYAGLVNSSPLPMGPLADLLVSTLNNNAGAFHQAPSALASEAEVVRTLSTQFGLPGNFEGMMLPGGTFANLQAVVLARVRAFPETLPAEARLYTSDQAHFSVTRSARIAGLSPSAIVSLPTRGRGVMDVQRLRDRIRADVHAGLKPFAVVASLGTTATGAIDPLSEIASVCRDEGLWFHVDACYGGASRLLPELAERTHGLTQADSVAVDAHKWFFVPLTAGLLLHRHPDAARSAFDTEQASYIPGGAQPYRRGMPTSRRASGLTWWMVLRAHGWQAVRQAVRSDIALSRRLEDGLRRSGFEVLEGGELSVACARWVPEGLSGESLDLVQEQIARRVCESGQAWFSTTRLSGASWLRFNLVNLRVGEAHVDRLVGLVTETALSGR